MTTMTFREVCELSGFSQSSLLSLVARGYVRAVAPADRVEDLEFDASEAHHLGIRPQARHRLSLVATAEGPVDP